MTLLPATWDLEHSRAERLTGGRWVGRPELVHLRGACLDSRQARPGCLFLCLQGERADGHDFAPAAVAAGAALVLARRPLGVPVPVLVVEDVAAAALALAGELRRQLATCTWIAVGGANGKTTCKTLLAAALAGSGAVVHATAGNLNNHLGVPLTVLATPAEARYAVIEVGANHPGEITTLATAVKPALAAIASLGPEHLEGFGSLEGVVRSEAELLAALPAEGAGVVGLHGLDEHARAHGTSLEACLTILRTAADGRRLELLDTAACPGRLEPDGLVLQGTGGEARLPLLGAHNLANAHLALRLARLAGCEEAAALRGLSGARPVPGRLVPRRAGGLLVLDDTYNANPASMLAGLHTLALAPGPRLAVLGMMGELGQDSVREHARIGAAAARLGLDLVCVGSQADSLATGCREAGGTCHLTADCAAAAALVRRLLPRGGTVLVKASRSQRLERVVDALLPDAAGRLAC